MSQNIEFSAGTLLADAEDNGAEAVHENNGYRPSESSLKTILPPVIETTIGENGEVYEPTEITDTEVA